MIILMKVTENERISASNKNELFKMLFQRAEEAYVEAIDNCEGAYLAWPYDDDTESFYEDEPDSLIDGATSPEKIKAIAQQWNGKLVNEFESALSKAMNTARSHGWLGVPTEELYEIKKSVMALNDDLHDFAKRGLLIGDYFMTRLTDKELIDVMSNPQNFAVITVDPR